MREEVNPEELDRMQYDLEEEAVLAGQKKYYEYLETHDKHQNHDRTAPALQLIRRTVPAVAEAIETDRQPRKGAGRGRRAVALCKDLDSDDLAYLTLRYALAGVNRETTWTVAANRVGGAVLEELRMRQFREGDPARYTQTQLRLREGRRKQANNMLRQARFQMQQAGIEPISWSAEDRIHVGTWLLDLLCRATGLFVDQTITHSRRKMVRMFMPTDRLMEWMDESHETLSMMCPIRMPMVRPPEPWTNPYDGGYLTDLGGEITLVKTKNRGYLEGLEQIDMPQVYDAVNALQDTAWRINQGVLETALALWRKGEAVGKPGKESMPSREPTPVPDIPNQWEGKVPEWRQKAPDEYKAWARSAAEMHQYNNRLRSKRKSCSEALAVAERMASMPAIYFPHQLDFRGRAYPVSAHLTPQGSDLSKGILQFAEGKPLGERGVFWLKVHIANCFGVDKCSYRDRVDWVDRRVEVLMDSALDPIDGEQYWRTADEPFQALAAIYELAGYLIEGPDYVSHLPVGMDGSCNGLQNFSAMLRDPVGGAATNLLPTEEPADIYNQVAQVVSERVRADAEAGDPNAVCWDGRVNRSIVKQPVMTLPYGATKLGMRKQIETAVLKAGNPLGISTTQMWDVCGYLAEVTYEAIGQVVIAAREAMDWLRETARLIASDDLPIRWTTPVGLPVLQEYRQYKGRQIKCHIDGQKVKLSVANDGPGLDRRRQATGISPNLVHSLDASAMMRTLLVCQENGLSSFGMVHDSYATHASEVDLMHTAIREAFVEMYSESILEQFRDELARQVPAGVREKFPELPQSGDLDLEVIKDSPYFFA